MAAERTGKYGEAPMLAALVAAGELPPVDERLPVNPSVRTPLQEAQNVRTVALAPWLFIPGVFIVITVLSFNFVGDGLRDAADPYR